MVMNFSATYSIVKSIEGFIGVEAIELQQFKKFFVSIYIYTINENDMHVFPLRNCGFAYEPGYFAGFIVFAVLVNVLRSKILFNRNFIVLVLGLITTVSTTGFIAFIAILAFYGFAKRIKYRVIIIPFVFVLIYYIINLDFMYSKVTELVLNQDKNTDMVLNAGATGQSLGRFAGLTFNLSRVLSESPIFGFFAQDSRIYGESIIAPNGFGVFILRFGFLGLIFFIWGLFKSSKKVIPLFTHSKYSLIYVIVASVWMFSFNQLFNVVFYVIFLYGFFKVPNQIKNNLA